MKMIRNIITNTFCVFSVLSILFGVLCRIDILKNLPYDQVIFVLLCMSIGTTLFVTLREVFIPGTDKLKYLIDICGCSGIILLIGYLAGWLQLSISYFILIVIMVFLVYLLVWIFTWLQSKHDEDDLNRLLAKHSSENKKLDKRI